MSSGRESAATATASRWAPELATLRALARDTAEQLQLPSRVAGGMSASASAAAGRDPTAPTRQPAGRRGREMDHGKTAKVMHLLLWGPK